jgi:hypothetical protein
MNKPRVEKIIYDLGKRDQTTADQQEAVVLKCDVARTHVMGRDVCRNRKIRKE